MQRDVWRLVAVAASMTALAAMAAHVGDLVREPVERAEATPPAQELVARLRVALEGAGGRSGDASAPAVDGIAADVRETLAATAPAAEEATRLVEEAARTGGGWLRASGRSDAGAPKALGAAVVAPGIAIGEGWIKASGVRDLPAERGDLQPE